MKRRIAVVLASLALSAGTGATGAAQRPAPAFVAIVGEGGLNVFHDDFLLGHGRVPRHVPVDQIIRLPRSGSFEERLASAEDGPLAALEPDILYWIEGTRILLMNPARVATSVLDERDHGTGAASAAVGARHGTAPDAFVVFLPGGSQPDAYRWIAAQEWVDVSSASVYSPLSCSERKAIDDVVASGRVVFRAAGNFEHAGATSGPGIRGVYQVGGVDDEGRTYAPGADRTHYAVTPTRPYETGDRFSFPAADPNALTGSATFGGTSGASPSTAGRAASLIAHARSLLARGVRPPGPLKDGRFTSDELTDLLHRVARPAEPPSPVRYLAEGYGALDDRAIAHARAVLAGEQPLPDRREEDEMHARVEELREILFPPARC